MELLKCVMLDIDNYLHRLDFIFNNYFNIDVYNMKFINSSRYPVSYYDPSSLIKRHNVVSHTQQVNYPFISVEAVARILLSYHASKSSHIIKKLFVTNTVSNSGVYFVSREDIDADPTDIIRDYIPHIHQNDLKEVMNIIDIIISIFDQHTNQYVNHIIKIDFESIYFILNIYIDIRAYRYDEILTNTKA